MDVTVASLVTSQLLILGIIPVILSILKLAWVTGIICIVTLVIALLLARNLTNKLFADNLKIGYKIDEIVSVDKITFSYKKNSKSIIKNLSFSVSSGETLGILGHNGVEKSALIKLIIGLLKLSQNGGKIVINKSLISNQRDIFLLSDGNNLSDLLTVRENLIFRKKLLDSNNLINLQTLDENELFKALDMVQYLDTRVKNLSSGFKKRAALVLGLVFSPKLIFLDEPTNSIDTQTKQILAEIIVNLKQSGKTVIIVTHDLNFCYDTCERVILLKDGTLNKDVEISAYKRFFDFQKAVDYVKPLVNIKSLRL
jgi:ABC-type multidrug transport system ATPase subunit